MSGREQLSCRVSARPSRGVLNVVRSRALSFALILLVLVVLSLSGCGPAEKEQDVSLLEGKVWRVTKYRTPTGRMLAPVASSGLGTRGMTLRFLPSERAATGSGGINSFSSQYEVDGDGNISFGAIAATSKAGDGALTAQEETFFEALEAATRFQVTNRYLELYDEDGTYLVRFRTSDEPELEGMAWRCTGFNNGTQPFGEVIEGSEITAEFDGGDLTGTAGVNRYQADYRLNGDSISIDHTVATTNSSGDEAEMQQEGAYLSMLERVVAYQIEDGSLVLFDNGGGRLASFEPLR